eukprot:4453517-Prymnesium_polylepis.1
MTRTRYANEARLAPVAAIPRAVQSARYSAPPNPLDRPICPDAPAAPMIATAPAPRGLVDTGSPSRTTAAARRDGSLAACPAAL